MNQTRLSRKLQDIQVNIDAYSIIGWLAMLAVPIAPMIYFGWRVYSSVLDETGLVWLAIIAAAVTAVGLEITGVLAGHRAMAFWRLGDMRRAALAGFILLAYIAIGVYELSNGFEEITIGATVFVIAPLVYLLVALGEVLEHEEKRETAVSRFQLEQDAKEADHRREMERQEKADQTAVKLAQTEANERVRIERDKIKAAKPLADGSQAVRKPFADEPAKHYECVCGRVFEGSRSYNAHRRHCEVPANEPARIYENGHQK